MIGSSVVALASGGVVLAVALAGGGQGPAPPSRPAPAPGPLRDWPMLGGTPLRNMASRHVPAKIIIEDNKLTLIKTDGTEETYSKAGVIE